MLNLGFQTNLADSVIWNLCDLQTQSGTALETAVIMSLFTWRRARPEDKAEDVYGWWAEDIGSRLYLLTRSKVYPGIERDAKTYIEEALQWMIEDGVASAINVTTELNNSNGHLYAKIDIARDEQTALELQWQNLWEYLR